MKKLLYIAIAIIAFSCSKDASNNNNQKEPTNMIKSYTNSINNDSIALSYDEQKRLNSCVEYMNGNLITTLTLIYSGNSKTPSGLIRQASGISLTASYTYDASGRVALMTLQGYGSIQYAYGSNFIVETTNESSHKNVDSLFLDANKNIYKIVHLNYYLGALQNESSAIYTFDAGLINPAAYLWNYGRLGVDVLPSVNLPISVTDSGITEVINHTKDDKGRVKTIEFNGNVSKIEYY